MLFIWSKMIGNTTIRITTIIKLCISQKCMYKFRIPRSHRLKLKTYSKQILKAASIHHPAIVTEANSFKQILVLDDIQKRCHVQQILYYYFVNFVHCLN